MRCRFVERGIRIVCVINASWDHDSCINIDLPHNCLMAEQPIAALAKDVKQRGLLEDTLVICGSEFGRADLGDNRSGLEVSCWPRTASKCVQLLACRRRHQGGAGQRQD